jgi:hypothetical protein
METDRMLTPYPEVNHLLRQMEAEIRLALGDQFIGMYLYGSLALGDFNPQKSDIDFIVVTAQELTDELRQALQAMHLRIASGPSRWAMELEGSYIPLTALRRYAPNAARHLHIDRGCGRLEVEQHDSDWVVQRYSLRKFGVVVAGPPIHSLIDPISPDDLRQAVIDLLWWWELQLVDTSRVEQSDYQAYAILSMCRILYTFRFGTIASKPAAARWAQRSLGEPWAALIERALTWQPKAPLDQLEKTLDFIRFTLERSQQLDLKARKRN